MRLRTGDGQISFNPNLYSSGKVCLSLLGTWKGNAGENWDSRTSKMLQVLVSIQSLILVPEPYFNEPGFEREIGTPEGEQRSRAFSQPIREHTLRLAINQALRGDGFGRVFREVVALHFRAKREAVLATVESWVAEATEVGPPEHLRRLQELRREMLELLQAAGREAAGSQA